MGGKIEIVGGEKA